MHRKFLLALSENEHLLVLKVEAHPRLSGLHLHERLREMLNTEDSFSVSSSGSLDDIRHFQDIPAGSIISSSEHPILTSLPAQNALFLQVIAGPDMGKRFSLHRNSAFRVGRTNGEIQIHDPLLDTESALVSMTPSGIFIIDDSEEYELKLHEEVIWGSSVVELVENTKCRHDVVHSDLFSPFSLDLPPRRPLFQQVAMIVLPLLVGGVIAVITGMWFFLMMSIASSLMLGINLKSGHGQSKKYRRILDDGIAKDKARAHSVHGLECPGALKRPLSEAMTWGRGSREVNCESSQLRFEDLPMLQSVPIYSRLYKNSAQVFDAHVSVSVFRHLLLQLILKTKGARIFIDPALLRILPAECELLQVLPNVELMSSSSNLDGGSEQDWLIFASESDVKLEGWIGSVVRFLEPHRNRPPVDELLQRRVPLTILDEDTSGAENNLALSFHHFAECPAPRFDTGQVLRCTAHGMASRTFEKLFLNWLNQLSTLALEQNSVVVSEHPLFDIDAAQERWQSSLFTRSLSFPVGISDGAETILDLSVHGPHLLLAGTTGSGKSQLLRSIILSLVYSFAPSRLALVLIDFKGAAGLGQFERLPHTQAVLSDLEEGEFDRSLKFLRADLEKRERLFRSLAVSSYTDYLHLMYKRNEKPKYPELLIVVDEFKMLTDQFPQSMNELMRVATIGRSLGVHLLLSTQKPRGNVSSDITSNIGTTLCLRVASSAESISVIDSDLAAKIPLSSPGAGYIKYSDGSLIPFQSLYIDSPRKPPEQAACSLSILGTGISSKTLIPESADEDARLADYVSRVQAVCAPSDYRPIPHRKASSTLSISEGRRLLLGVVEIAAAGDHHEVELDSQIGPISLVAEQNQRWELLRTLAVQALAADIETHILCGEYSSFTYFQNFVQESGWQVSSLVGPFDPEFQTLVWREVTQESSSNRPILFLIDGLDSWLEMHVKELEASRTLQRLLMNAPTKNHIVVAGSHTSLKGSMAQLFSTQLLSDEAISKDPLKSISKNILHPAPHNFSVEGKLVKKFSPHSKITSAELIPAQSALPRDISPPISSHECWNQLPLKITLKEAAKLPLVFPAHLSSQQNLVLRTAVTRHNELMVTAYPMHQCTAIVGPRLSGKTALLDALQQLNPEYSYLRISGKIPATAEQLAEIQRHLETTPHLVLLLDDLQFVAHEVQQKILQNMSQLEHVFFTVVPNPRLMSLPLYSAGIGAIRGFALMPQSPRDLEFFASANLADDLKTEGQIPAGRVLYINQGDSVALQVPIEGTSR